MPRWFPFRFPFTYQKRAWLGHSFIDNQTKNRQYVKVIALPLFDVSDTLHNSHFKICRSYSNKLTDLTALELTQVGNVHVPLSYQPLLQAIKKKIVTIIWHSSCISVRPLKRNIFSLFFRIYMSSKHVLSSWLFAELIVRFGNHVFWTFDWKGCERKNIEFFSKIR